MNLKAVLIDDEPSAVEILTLLLNKYCPNIEIVGSADGVEGGVSLIKDLEPDLVFLDIEMPEGSGFEVVSRTSDYLYKLIFTTAYNQYAIRAFKVNAIDYLLKPIDIGDLITAVNRASEHMNEQVSLKKIAHLFNPNQSQLKLSIPTQEGYVLIPFDEISHVSGDSNYSKIHTINGKEILVSKTLKKIESQLNADFLRVHNSHVVNIRHIERFLKIDGGYIVMQSQIHIPVSKSKKDQVMSLFLRE